MPPDHLDTLLGFALPNRDARGRFVRLGPALDTILAAHDYPDPIARLLAESIALTALLGSTLKDAEGQMTLQAQTKGGLVELLVCDWRGGEVRGYAKFDAERAAALPITPTLPDLFGSEGHLAITFDQAATGERYQGIVPLEGDTIGDAAENFLRQSEQIPSLVRLATAQTEQGWRAGGLLLQHLAEGEQGRERLHTRLDHPQWGHVRLLGETVAGDELVDAALPLETLLWRLFNQDEVRVLNQAAIRRGCRCDPDYVAGVIARFPPEERAAMVDDDGVIRVDCAFCATSFPIALETLAA